MIGIGSVRERLEAVAARERRDPAIDPDLGTRWWLHDEPAEHGVVLLHGFTNNPKQWAELGPLLHADGHNVIAPRFPYHGYRDRMTEAIAHLTLSDYLETALEATLLAAGCARRVSAIGISAAGTVCAWMASRLAVQTSIAIAPFFGIRGLPGAWTDVAADLLCYGPNAFLWWDPRGDHRDLIPAHAYPRFSTRALGQSLRVGTRVARLAREPSIGNRLVLILNERDPAVNNRLARRRALALAHDHLRVDVVEPPHLPPRHDIIEPTLPHAPTAIVYPLLRALVAATDELQERERERGTAQAEESAADDVGRIVSAER